MRSKISYILVVDTPSLEWKKIRSVKTRKDAERWYARYFRQGYFPELWQFTMTKKKYPGGAGHWISGVHHKIK